MLRRVILLVVCLAMPVQGAFGATGLLCGAVAHHMRDLAPALHAHDALTDSGGHDHAAGALSENDEVTGNPGSQESHDLTGKCKICSECCSSAAALAASIPAVFPSDTPLRVSATADPAMASRAGDGLFRPPRTTSL